MDIALKFENVSRQFTLDDQRPRSIQEVFLSIIQRQPRRQRKIFWALQDINFEVLAGDTVGLIGVNGAGKSTLLKLIAGIIPPTTGRIEINGQVRALLELGAGFHHDLTGRENIFLNGAILGLRHQEIEQKLDEIIAFAELERFIDVPVRHYSSGMYLRLGFSVAIHTHPDILIVDEALAVGDQSFQAKCIQRINNLKNQGVTIIFVSHSIDLIGRICNSAIWLEQGQLQISGSIEQVGDAYRNHLAQKRDSSQAIQSRNKGVGRWGSGEAQVSNLAFLNSCGQPTHLFSHGQPMTIRIHYQTTQRVKTPRFGLAFYHAESGLHLSGPNNIFDHCDIPWIEGNDYVDFNITNLPFLSGDYLVSAAIYDYAGEHAYDHRHQMGFFTVQPTVKRLSSGKDEEAYGLVDISAKWATSTESQILADTKESIR